MEAAERTPCALSGRVLMQTFLLRGVGDGEWGRKRAPAAFVPRSWFPVDLSSCGLLSQTLITTFWPFPSRAGQSFRDKDRPPSPIKLLRLVHTLTGRGGGRKLGTLDVRDACAPEAVPGPCWPVWSLPRACARAEAVRCLLCLTERG